ncbi:MAG: DUF1697 domain-containing protein [Acidimicrobiales bacterium]|nr:DUF1697 domain-containing protein [Acidimicrobiales bacterium]
MGTERYALLLRAVNLGGHGKVSMVELRAALTDAGYGGVATYIQSGNVALDADAGEEELTAAVEAVIAERFGLAVPVVARRHAELAAIVAANPFPHRVDEPSRLGVGFARSALPSAFTAVTGSVDEVAVLGREVFIYCPNGFGRAKLPAFDRQAGVPVTVRNWNTVLKLLSMTQP